MERKDQKIAAERQIGGFKEAACSLGCDEDEATFNEKLKAIAHQKPKTKPDTNQRTKSKTQK